MQRRQTAWVQGFTTYAIIFMTSMSLIKQSHAQNSVPRPPSRPLLTSPRPHSRPQKLATPTTTATPANARCSIETFTRDCTAFQRAGVNLRGNKELGIPQTQDHSICFNPIAALNNTDPAGLEKMTRRNPGTERQALAIADRTRAEMIRYLTNDAPKANWSAEQKAMVTRLETLRIEFVDTEDPYCSELIPAGFPNMVAELSTHTVKLCPAYGTLPAAQIARGLAHELGHIVSPCSMAKVHYTVDRDAFVDETAVIGCLGISEMQIRAYRSFFDADYMVLPVGDYTANAFEECLDGIRETPNTRIGEAGIFGSHLRCLKSTWEAPWKANVEMLITETAEAESHRPIERVTERVRSENPHQCHRQLDEHFADSVSAKIFGRMIENGQIKREDVRAATIDSAAYVCEEQLNGTPAMDNISYPSTEERLQILLSDPFVQDSLGCHDVEGPPMCTLSASSDKTTSGTKSGAPVRGGRNVQ